ncbi:MAG TPA: T9SS type A sorting domain-containing protein [candidate division WOR-3 bacterium]|uniref:T9SS type A sorting domain-containing protein n=1 Tax=candidate division WOR-3 bacterium TaxID=2052148 RepID=A0A9C9K0B1_UNCW3|nr:T9SS type A sorting domain-containing protein [candidate division WOR-3 bacterium]
MILIFLLLSNISFHSEYYTNTNFYYEITGKDSIIYGASNGGAVVYNRLSGSFRVLTNSDGLQTNRQRCTALDSSGYIWFGNEFGLALVSGGFDSVLIYPPECLACTRIQGIICLKDSVYVASSGGLLFIATNSTPADFSDDSRLRIFTTDGLPSNNVLSLAVHNNRIWVGTDNGIACFTKDFNPDSTFTYNTSHGLLDTRINKIAVIDTTIYVGTDAGLNRFNGSYFDTLLLGYGVCDITYRGDSLALALDSLSQFGFLFQGNLVIEKEGIPYRCDVFSLLNINDTLFCGLGNRYTVDYYGRGIGRFDADGELWELIERECLPSNHISEITANEYGVFVACGARAGYSRGIGWLDNEGDWSRFGCDTVLSFKHIHRCVTAPDGKVWFGVNPFSSSGADTLMAFAFEPLTQTWTFLGARYHGMDSSVAVWDLEFDSHNNMYISLAGPSDKLWVIDSALNEVCFLGEKSTGFKVELALDSIGRVWSTMIGAEGGLMMIDTDNTLFDRSDDSSIKFGESDGMLSKYAVGCIVDRNNNLYVANEVGLLMYDGSTFSGFTDISNEELFDVELDSEGRVWLLAMDGIYFYDPRLKITDGYTFKELGVHIEFMDFSNEIVQVQGFEFDPIRNCFWIGGETGLLKLEVQFDTLPALDSILLYPNPVVNHSVVKIKNIPADARVSIYSISGRLLVRGLEPDPVFGEVVWDIPDDLSSGLYFVLVNTPRGNRVCKFAVVK